MASSNQLSDFDFTSRYLNCSECCSDSKKFKIPLSAYGNDGRCKLTAEQKKSFSFVCRSCGYLNELNFMRACTEYSEMVVAKIIEHAENNFLAQTKKNFQIEKEFSKLKIAQ